jgi:flagellar hook-associated protein 1 FlgK
VTSPFFGLDIATRALRTQQTLVDIANQNVANANTPGYSRQSGELRTTAPFPIPTRNAGGRPGQLGTGVEVAEVRRARDGFLDYQVRNQLTSQSNWDIQRDSLKQIESVVNEPSANGLASLMSKYWKGWQELANNPSDSAVRANLIEQGKAVASAFQSNVQRFQQQQRDLDQQVGLAVTDVNSYAQQIANINQQVVQIEAGGLRANDLRDRRDQLVDKLSSLVKISSVESAAGSLTIYVGNRQLVDRSTANKLQAVVPSGQPFYQVQWMDGTPTTIADGKLAGIVTSRDSLVALRITDLDTLAGRVIESVNALHTSGVGLDGRSGRNFFAGTNASTIAVDPALTAAGGTGVLAAARMTAAIPPATGFTWASGDSSNAVAIAQLQNSVGQRNVTAAGAMVPGQVVGPSTVQGLDLSRAAVNTTYTLSVVAGGAPNNVPTVTISNGSSSVAATVTVGTDASGNQIMAVDAPGMGLRMTVSAAAGTTQDAALIGFNGRTVVTQASPSTIGNQYGQVVARVGVASSTAQTQSANQAVLVNQLQRNKQNVSGVSLDEEATHLIQYQRAYQAAARVISVVDSMLDTLINHTGRG